MMNRVIAALLCTTAVAKSDITCGLDAHIINETTFPLIREDLAGSLLAAMCGANRGLFVTSPGDGHVYGCGLFPPQWANEKVEHCATHPCACATWDANAVVQQYDGGNLTAAEAVDIYDQYVAAVYASSPEKEKDVRACDAGGFAVLSGAACVAPSDTYRAVTLRGIAGLDGNGHTVAHTPHSSKDYEAITALGLDSVRIPVKAEDVKQFDTGDLRVILAVYGDAAIDLDGVALVEADVDATEVRKAAKAAGVPVLLRLESEAALNSYAGTDGVAYAISRACAASIINFDGVRRSAVESGRATNAPPPADAATVVDVASSSPEEDRTKLFYHEATSCGDAALSGFVACQKRAPFFVRSWSLAIDDCDAKAGEYGQCDHLDDRLASPWWARHTQSFAARQRDAYERSGSLGWSFGAWKFDDTAEAELHPAVLAQRSLKAASKAGWLPSLVETPALSPCLSPPLPDFALGDATASPSSAPFTPPAPDWPVEAPAPSRLPAAFIGFACGALLVALVKRNRGGYDAIGSSAV